MVIREYGTENSKNLVFFQGSCEPWEEFRPAAEGLAKAFHVMLVTKEAPKLNTQIQFWVGADEWGSRYRDLKWTKQYLPQLEIVKIPHMMHGEFVMMHPEAFTKKALEFLQ